MADMLDFGETKYLIKFMKLNDQEIISHKYGCTGINGRRKFLSWLGCLNIVRNICAHNEDLLDFQFRTPPMMPDYFRSLIVRGKHRNAIATVLFIIKYLTMFNIPMASTQYNFKGIQDSLKKITYYRNKKKRN